MEAAMKRLIDIEDNLLREAMDLSGTGTKKETIRMALEELIRSRRRQTLKSFAGSGIVDMTTAELRRLRRRSSR
jgi:Arc/MetJ family transcription regulator